MDIAPVEVGKHLRRQIMMSALIRLSKFVQEAWRAVEITRCRERRAKTGPTWGKMARCSPFPRNGSS